MTASLTLVAKFPVLAAKLSLILDKHAAALESQWQALSQYDPQVHLTRVFTFIFSTLGFLTALSNPKLTTSGTESEPGNQILRLEILRTFKRLRILMNDKLLTYIESAVSSLRVIDSEDHVEVSNKGALGTAFLEEITKCRHYDDLYSEHGMSVGALLFSNKLCLIAKSIVGSYLPGYEPNSSDTIKSSLINALLNDTVNKKDVETNPQLDIEGSTILKEMVDFAFSEIEILEEGANYIELSSPERIEIAYSTKAIALEILSVGIFYDIIPVEPVTRIFESSVHHPLEMSDLNLGLNIVRVGSLICHKDVTTGAILTRAYPHFLSNSRFPKFIAEESAKSLAMGLKFLSQDAVITTIYSLINLLAVDSNGSPYSANQTRTNISEKRSLTESRSSEQASANGNEFEADGSYISLLNANGNTQEEYQHVFENIIKSIVTISKAYGDSMITIMTVSILCQKFVNGYSFLDKLIIDGLAECAVFVPEKEFNIILKLYTSVTNANVQQGISSPIVKGIVDARIKIAKSLSQTNPLFEIYLAELLNNIKSKGDAQVSEHHRSHVEISTVANEIAVYLKPLSSLLPSTNEAPLKIKNSTLVSLFADIWYNMVIHGYSISTKICKEYLPELERIAWNSPPLVSEMSSTRTETSLELNTVLRRGSSNHNVRDQRTIMGATFDDSSLFELKTMSRPKLMFLAATLLLESLRANCGDCSMILLYFSDPSIKSGDINKYISKITLDIANLYILSVKRGGAAKFSADNVAKQLKKILTLCCHRISELQEVAFKCCDLIIKNLPSCLCNKESLYALVELLSLLFESCLDADSNQYEPRSVFRSKRVDITLRLSDSYSYRRATLSRFHSKAREWVRLVLTRCNDDMKSLLSAYISDSGDEFKSSSHMEYGISLAIEMAGSISSRDRELSSIGLIDGERPDSLAGFLSQFRWRTSFKNDVMSKLVKSEKVEIANIRHKNYILLRLQDIETQILQQKIIPNSELFKVLQDAAGYLILINGINAEIARALVKIPFIVFTAPIIKFAAGIWSCVINEKPELESLLLSEIEQLWEDTIESKVGLYSKKEDIPGAEYCLMEYAPTDMEELNLKASIASKSLEPHLYLIRMFASHFQATLYLSDHLLKIFTRIVIKGLQGISANYGSFHPYARLARFELIRFGLDVLSVHIQLSSRIKEQLKDLVFSASLNWFTRRQNWPFGGNLLKIKTDYTILIDVFDGIKRIEVTSSNKLAMKKQLLLNFLADEIKLIDAWLNPVETTGRDNYVKQFNAEITDESIKQAYDINPSLAVNLFVRYNRIELQPVLESLLLRNPVAAIDYPDAVQYFLNSKILDNQAALRYLIYWEPVSPIDSINLFLPPFVGNPYILQYAMRSLEGQDVNLTFFYVQQIVQLLRHDTLGYVERFILETANISQLFAHQIIWNILANQYKDEDATIPDSLKPSLDRVMEKLISSFRNEDRLFYEKEFGFFNEVTSISGKLKPYIKKTKAEKKAKIDEEMSQIVVKPGVYLPSNPDGVVVGIDRMSGRPLQSHAKAPFMATFKIRKEVSRIAEASFDNDASDDTQLVRSTTNTHYIEKWQSAIFKVGDDCRQDVLVLQIISVFRTIFNVNGVDVYVFPYRVTATAPGCGVIDVLPNSISRDMLGREAVNGLYEYFISKFGPEDSIEFQKARNNFVKSLAAYSVISYLLQFKDRHNGNIMYDDQGHILHIDFGFCFDITPGGVKFEHAPFKLTHEMIQVLGGSTQTQAYKWFEELCVKSFLAVRPYSETIVKCVKTMMDSGLPCFKEQTIKKLRQRFALNRTEKEAAQFMRGLIRKSYESLSSKGYDGFQKLTNGIPY